MDRVGFIGTGVMGLSMAGHLMDAGYPLGVFNRTRERANPSSSGGPPGMTLRHRWRPLPTSS